MQLISLFAGVLSVSCTAVASPHSQPFSELLRQRHSTTSGSLEVDLGYEIYRGVSNSSTGINTWKGIRFAAPPTGKLRWQLPHTPAVNRTRTIQADTYGSECKQVAAGGSPATFQLAPGSEDCLFLNVQSPANATNLPVLVWIHGGGYGLGSGQQDFTDILTTNGLNFVVVSIQYRLGPFGFLASDEVARKGVVNAGLHDQYLALQWIQAYISQFGGDPSAVTISGESSGGGSVMLHDMAYGGHDKNSLFHNIIAASPYLPKQHAYNASIPTKSYYAFAERAGCPVDECEDANSTVFECLLSKDTATLQNASTQVGAAGAAGQWTFLPVTDGSFVQSTPSKQLLEKRVNGRTALVGNAADEGPLFVPQNITSQDQFMSWLRGTLPGFSDSDIAEVLAWYPIKNNTESPNAVKFATTGLSGPSALDQSSVAVGQQQRANNLYAELTFICPSYWIAAAYSGGGRTSYQYQYSALPATHAIDVAGYLGPLGKVPFLSVDFQRAFMTIWGNFITKGNPSIPASVAAGSNATAKVRAATQWPVYTVPQPYLVNLNQTGGQLIQDPSRTIAPVNLTYAMGPGLVNEFTLGNAYNWENGRGARCDFWRSVANIIPA
ncbi:PnbA Carboxylesterase type B [Pyrenophora tritici-repentis]|uniref:Carboxylic ester hydrolase n=2 Tax=Pyrenophora tritici-repentis TaxID=45151 RepID=A0A2W1DHX4_9PLEO|nr:acetylcholinesterase precursor [Pyrenophora tritici-repentis Pt-1C-BFP]KAA8626017.1 PnbA Carboxylesterase type B [Pyrenophora tritici-repentis]EDU40805.1 acetylcholinesterase precursor [Pyrenophora tritici-repentis Pt-1C-BFP]KAF7454430.1 PnbA Carboxylesterase type B [Pyrenophora tritici-repentis]KAF7577550.1 PnbA, Carboxylesterase type B [Pyrenophora tritici-repentis]KAG9388176.1 PnbA Carboxylesterase type B [Pyrenophora tritici-repentis]